MNLEYKSFVFASIDLDKTFCFLEKRLRQGFGWNANPQSKRVNEARSGIDPKRSERFQKKTKSFIRCHFKGLSSYNFLNSLAK